ncbi:DUF4184 family protein [Acinetobacter sp. AOR15_HL]|uniref:DUF4184 family protein n=1 Tax=unclassified Acinetobacter TaxID=196816 RepID=UPI0022EAF9E2|nr:MULTISPECIES: DUF4184 family protein [unclassified Acinetobacter]MDA3557139.1 DUF4184 family protein [Acinetobacter sp. AOR15_HL]MDA3572748.1 DUF4184 family protein [Acinetobacter sp. AOR14_HL]
MPFTISHAVIASPLSKLSQNTLPIAALAIGSMTPDLYRLFTVHSSMLTHQWKGLIYPNLALGLLFCAVWYFLYRPVIYRFFGVQHDLALNSLKRISIFFIGIIFALIIGIATHLIWDGLTHADFRTFVFKDVLATTVHLFGRPYPLHRLLQLGSSALALPFLAWMCIHYYQHYKQHWKVSRKIKNFAWSLFILSTLLGLFSFWDYARYIPHEVWHADTYYFTGRSINEFMQGWLSTFSLGCLLFLFLDRQQRMG